MNWSVCMLIVSFTEQADALDPCLSGNHGNISFLEKRDPSYVMDSNALCDRYITHGWYGTKGYLMSTTHPELTKCGTLYPVWLNGETPSNGQSAVRTACEVGFSSTCTRSYSIEVKNCGDVVVYKLQSTETCNSAYCFEKIINVATTNNVTATNTETTNTHAVSNTETTELEPATSTEKTTNIQPINTETTEIESTNIQTTNTEATNIESTDIQTTNTEATTIESTDIQTTNTEATNVESTNIQTINTEATNIESTNIQTTNIETTNIESTDIQTTNTEATTIESTDIQTTKTEATNVESTNIQTINTEATNIESTNIQTTNTETTNIDQTTNTETTRKKETPNIDITTRTETTNTETTMNTEKTTNIQTITNTETTTYMESTRTKETTNMDITTRTETANTDTQTTRITRDVTLLNASPTDRSTDGHMSSDTQCKVSKNIEVFNDQFGDIALKLLQAFDRNNSTCFRLPLQDDTIPFLWTKMNVMKMFGIKAPPFEIILIGQYFTCNRHSDENILQVFYKDQGQPSQFCSLIHDGGNQNPSFCKYNCACANPRSCREVMIYFGNGNNHGQWSLCEIVALNS